MNYEDKIKHVFDSYDTSDPFELARYLNIRITYFDFESTVYGYYTPLLSTNHIIISESLSPEDQEKVCDHLVAHHILNTGTEFCLDKSCYAGLERETKFSRSLFPRKSNSLFWL